jgi:5-formyltetrahydrofolate cyclo-ligase
MRERRRALSPQARRASAHALARQVAGLAVFRYRKNIAFYLANDGEMDLMPLLRLAWRMRKRCYLPALRPRPWLSLWFAPYRRGDRLRINRFGIAEPKRPRRPRPPWSLGLALVPLVAFDAQGNRLGMGGGFYDRTFAYLNRHPLRGRPHLLGIAYAFQQAAPASLAPATWDVPLWGVATEVGIHCFGPHAACE